MASIRVTNWDDIKNFINSRPNSSLQFVETASIYELIAVDNLFQLEMTLQKGSTEATDFENNFKADANKELGNPEYNSEQRLTTQSKLIGSDGNHEADVVKENGLNRLATTQTVNVNELLGTLVHPSTWFSVDQADDGSSITVAIPDDSVNVETSVTSSEAGDLHATAKKIEENLNDDVTFSSLYLASKPEGTPRVSIRTKRAGDKDNERPNSGDFSVSASAGASVTVAYDNIVQRDVPTALFPHPQDPTKGTFSVTGQLEVVNRSVKNYNPGYLKNSQGSFDMKVDGSSSPIEFKLDAFDERDFVITSVKILAEDGNINMHRFLDTTLSNGFLYEIVTDGETVTFPALLTTVDFLQIFTSKGGFHEIKANKTAQFIFNPKNPFILKKGTNDKVSITVRDDMSGMVSLTASVEGYLL